MLKRKKISIKGAVNKLDKLCRQILRLRDSDGFAFTCVSCGRRKPVEESNVSHYVSRQNLGLRHDLHNIHLACTYCNNHLHGNLIEYRKELLRRYGAQDVERLENTPRGKASVVDLEVMIQEYKQILADLERARG